MTGVCYPAQRVALVCSSLLLQYPSSFAAASSSLLSNMCSDPLCDVIFSATHY